MFEIYYNEVNPFSGISPTPYVERGVNPIHNSKYHGDVDSVVLNGVITGFPCQSGDEFSFFWDKANTLIDRFSAPFKRITIRENLGGATSVLYSEGNAIIRSIDFDEGRYAGILPYSVSLDIYKDGTLGASGILEPSQDINFEDSDGDEIIVKKTTKARGFNNSNEAMENATQFVNSLTGIQNVFPPLFITGFSQSRSILRSLNERVNRLEGTYQVEEEWVCSQASLTGQTTVYQTTTSIESGQNGIVAKINGEIKGSIGCEFSKLRNTFNSIDFFGLVNNEYENFSNGALFAQPISKEINENLSERTLGFSFTYSDNITEDPYIVDSISVSNDLEKNKKCVNASISIISTDLCPTARWEKVKDFESSFSIKEWIEGRLDELGYSIVLPNSVTSSSVSYDEVAGSIGISAAVCEKKIIVPSHFSDINYNVSVKPAMPSFAPFQGIDCGGAFTIQKLFGNTRKTVTIQGDGIILNCSTYDQARASLISYINGIKFLYIDGNDAFLTQHSIQKGTGAARNRVSFSFSWNEKSDLIFPDSKLHSSIS